jgi:hypothetical protein
VVAWALRACSRFIHDTHELPQIGRRKKGRNMRPFLRQPVRLNLALTAIVIVAIAASSMVTIVMTSIAITPVISTVPLTAPAWMFILIPFPNPLLLNKINWLSAGVVSAAMFAPVLLVARWNVQVNGLALHSHWLLHDDDRLRLHQHRLRVVANVDSPIDTRLVDADRYTDTGLCHCRTRGTGERQNGNRGDDSEGSKFFH